MECACILLCTYILGIRCFACSTRLIDVFVAGEQ